MPTYELTDRFLREFNALSREDKIRFRRAVANLTADLRIRKFRKGLRVKTVQGATDTWEMTWAPNGRALFTYGTSVRPGHQHVIWLRCGGHEIFENL